MQEVFVSVILNCSVPLAHPYWLIGTALSPCCVNLTVIRPGALILQEFVDDHTLDIIGHQDVRDHALDFRF